MPSSGSPTKKPSRRPEPTAERLQKRLAAAGLGSRREIERWIAAGRVTLNGQVAKLGDRVAPGDAVAVDGKPFESPRKTTARVLLYHKPLGELVTRSDPEGRSTVFSRLPPGRWIAVGRLDINSTGLLLLTDSGELANQLMHPRYGLEREYLARVKGELSAAELARLREGILLDGVPARFERIDSDRPGEGVNRWYRVVLREGRNREVRRLFEALGHPVSRLSRVRYGPVELPTDLAPGKWRELVDTAKISKL